MVHLTFSEEIFRWQLNMIHDGAPAPERRSFLGVISGLIVAGVSTVLGVTIGRFSISPAFSTSGEQEWTDLGSLGEFAEGKLLKKNVVVSQDAGWGKFQSQRSVWIVRKGEKREGLFGRLPAPRLFGQRARREIYLRLPQQRVERRRRDAGRADSARA